MFGRNMQEQIENLRKYIASLSADPGFIHYKWFVVHHLDIVAQLADELCDLYPKADRNVVQAMVWLHDLGKILTSMTLPRDEEDRITQSESAKLLQQLGFAEDFIAKVVANLATYETYGERDPAKENIEVDILSSADACSHYVGPFMSLYWYENPDQGVDQLVQSGMKKAQKDWQHKRILPEARAAFQRRLDQIAEHDPANRNKRFFS